MELLAAIRALERLSRTCKIKLFTDSQYLKQGITSWLPKWKAKNWKKSDGKPVKNKDLWQILDTLTSKHEIDWIWIQGHSGHKENTIVDKLARDAIILGKKNKLKPDPLG